ncbi:MAG TPA: hypothetical protein VG937_24170 [Polyangiaceae bacterium]|nr:hypothetical protein [Polyangiaceae bacterium]
MENYSFLPFPDLPSAAESAYAAVLPELEALSAAALESVDVDVPKVVQTVLAALPDILALVPQIAEELPLFDIRTVKHLERRALALAHAHDMYVAERRPGPTLLVGDDRGSGQARTDLLRDCAWTLLKWTYGQTRLAVQFVRRNERDADGIAPGLYGQMVAVGRNDL